MNMAAILFLSLDLEKLSVIDFSIKMSTFVSLRLLHLARFLALRVCANEAV